MLQEEVGSFNAAKHLLRAYDAAARVIPETCALVYSGPVRHYARMIALDPERIVDDGSDYLRPPHYQHPVWGSEGGSVYDVTPPEHMRRIRELGVLALAHADSALAEATKGIRALQETRDVMEAIQLLTVYYDEKIAATVAALIYVETEDQRDRELAEEQADEALSAYLRAGEFMHRNLDPYYRRISGSPLAEAGVELPELMILEREDRDQIWAIFGVE